MKINDLRSSAPASKAVLNTRLPKVTLVRLTTIVTGGAAGVPKPPIVWFLLMNNNRA